ncbi:MAG: NAD(P)-dependent oxidoreductase [Steroidobacteraceae bacterium]
MKVGFIGLGAMGFHMAHNLRNARLLHLAYNRSAARAEEFRKETASPIAASVEALARDCELIVMCVGGDGDVLSLVARIAKEMPRGGIVIDCSTVSRQTAVRAAAELGAYGIAFLDCPVSGGTEGARLGTLAIMAGGDRASFERAQPVLAAMGKTVRWFGPAGSGQAAKATNQIMCAGIIRAVAEAMAFARAEGLPLETLVDTLGKGAGSSWYFVHRAPFMIKGEYPAGFRVRLHEKDLRICRDMAAAHGATLPVVEEVLAEYQALIREGYGDEDISALYRLKEPLFHDPGEDGTA